MSEHDENDIIPAGLQVVCSRKNAHKTGNDKKADLIIDPVQDKFYRALTAARQKAKADGKKPQPMFRSELLYWGEDGSIQSEVIIFPTLSPDSVKILHDVLKTRIAAPGPRKRLSSSSAPVAGDDMYNVASEPEEAEAEAEAEEETTPPPEEVAQEEEVQAEEEETPPPPPPVKKPEVAKTPTPKPSATPAVQKAREATQKVAAAAKETVAKITEQKQAAQSKAKDTFDADDLFDG